MRYIKETINYGLLYIRCDDFQLIGYTHSDWVEDVDERKSTTCYVFFLGNRVFSWSSKKQPIITLSTCEAEYVTASSRVCHIIWLRNLLNDLHLNQEQPKKIYIDSKLVIALAKNLVFHERSKHIDTRYHFNWETINEKVELIFVKTQGQPADIFTKSLKHEVFSVIWSQLGMITLGLRGNIEN